jgi:hypothetical protein
MSNQPAKPTNPTPKSEKNTDATAVLSPEELRAIAGGGGQPSTNPVTTVGGFQPSTTTKVTKP